MRSSSLPGAATSNTGCSSINAATRNSANGGVNLSTKTVLSNAGSREGKGEVKSDCRDHH